jgi:diguanylate cyclase
MDRIVYCLTVEHDLRLVVIAGLVSLLSGAVGYDLLARARSERPLLWISAAAFVTGSGIWATHFIAILAYDPGVALGFGLLTTAASGVGGTLIAGVGFAAIVYGHADRILPAAGGAIVGGGVAVLHYVGMAALVIPGAIVWDGSLVGWSILLGCALGAASGELFRRARGTGGRLAAAVALTLAVCSHHFTAMAAVSIRPLATVARDGMTLPKTWLVAAILATMVVILILGIVGGTFGRVLASRRQHEARRLTALANAAFEGIVICRDGLVLDANESFCRLLGMPPERVRGRAFIEFAGPVSRQDASYSLAADTHMPLSVDLVAANGELVPTEILKRVVSAEEGEQVVLAVRDLRERREAESRIRYLAHHDALTGLANRMFFGLRLDDVIGRTARSGGMLGIYYIDLDRFKDVNDAFGHAIGDQVLIATARRLEDLARAGDIVARLGGDEFIVVQAELANSEAAVRFAAQLCATLHEPIVLDSHQIMTTASVGMAVYPDDGTDAEGLTHAADLALYRAKEDGRATFRAFETEMAERIRQRRLLQMDLQKAVADRALTMHYQPQVRVSDGELLAFEALVRWTHPEHGEVPPTTFVPLAEESGLMPALGEWVLRTVCREAAGWRRPVRVAVNLSPIQIIQGDLPSLVHAILLETGMNPERLELEVTESVLIKDMDRALRTLRRLKALGIRIAMDDFGTGYSSLSYLQSFPFDRLKIDRSFVHNLDHNAHSRAIVRAVVGLGRALNLPVVAEGVESSAQLEVLRTETCDEVQGFLTGRPQPIEAFAAYLRSDGDNVRAFASAG